MEAASTSEMLVNFYQITLRNNPEDSHLLGATSAYVLELLTGQVICLALMFTL
jgi:hypothetical protein